MMYSVKNRERENLEERTDQSRKDGFRPKKTTQLFKADMISNWFMAWSLRANHSVKNREREKAHFKISHPLAVTSRSLVNVKI